VRKTFGCVLRRGLAKALAQFGKIQQQPQITRGLVGGVARHNAEYFAPGFDPDHKNNYPLAEAALRELGLAIAS